MNNIKNVKDNYSVNINNDHSSLSEVNIDEKNKKTFNILNDKTFVLKRKNKNNMQNSFKEKNLINNKYLIKNNLSNFSQKEKNRNIKPKISKENENYLYGNYIKNKKPFKCGKVYCFLYINNYPALTIGPQYYYPIILILLNNMLFFLTINYIYNKFNILFKNVGIVLIIIVNISQLYTIFINEGIPKRNWYLNSKIIANLIEDENFYNEFNTNKYQICRKCNILIDKSLKIIHCDICNICCEFYDHHCPWIGKCIGKNNILSFKIFIFSNSIYILYNLILLFIFIFIKFNK